MRENDFSPSPGSRKASQRKGRGNATGQGTYAGKGLKGQKARAGGGVRPYFEGGQLPLVKRMPHLRGFTNRFRVEYVGVNVGRLDRFPDGAEVTPESLREVGILRKKNERVKILGGGEISRPLIIRVEKVTPSARQKIEAAGGRVEEA